MALRASGNIILSAARIPAAGPPRTTHVTTLYKAMIRELPRVLQIYDLDIPIPVAQKAIRFQFDRHKGVKDPRVINLLVAKGYMDLEETLAQWRQAAHLIDIFDPVDLKEKQWKENLSLEEKIVLGIDARYN